MNILKAYRDNSSNFNRTTILKDSNNKVKAIFNGNIKQPRKGTKILTINGFKYSIDWSNAEKF